MTLISAAVTIATNHCYHYNNDDNEYFCRLNYSTSMTQIRVRRNLLQQNHLSFRCYFTLFLRKLIQIYSKLVSWCFEPFTFTFTYPLTAGVVGAQHMTSQQVSSVWSGCSLSCHGDSGKVQPDGAHPSSGRTRGR